MWGLAGVDSGCHSDYPSSESFLESEMARFPSLGQAESSGIAQVSPTAGALELGV